MSDRLELDLRADLSELARLAETVDDFADRNGLPPDIAFKLNLCLDELITNIVTYGYADVANVPPRAITVRLGCDDAALQVEIEDKAAPFDPFTEVAAPDLTSDVEDRPIGGLGVFLVKQTMDRADYRRDAGRNLVRLTKFLAGRPA
jgi:serine/threonine-protein kinase RsbW